MGMKWYKFLIRFALFFAALTNFAEGLGYVTGVVYETETSGRVSAEMVYEMWGVGLKIADVLVGIALIGLAVFAIVVRNKLAKYKIEAPRCLNIYHFAFCSLKVAYSLIIIGITGTNTMVSTAVSSCIQAVVLICINTKYFEKRKSMFLNT